MPAVIKDSDAGLELDAVKLAMEPASDEMADSDAVPELGAVKLAMEPASDEVAEWIGVPAWDGAVADPRCRPRHGTRHLPGK
jgi:hypothetical protein